LPPIQQGREFHSLDTTGDSKTKKKPVEMGLHSAARHVELSGYFSVVATLQKQFDDLLFAWTEPNSLLLHSILPLFSWIALRPRKASWRLHLSKSHSTHVATLRQILTYRPNRLFNSLLQGFT